MFRRAHPRQGFSGFVFDQVILAEIVNCFVGVLIFEASEAKTFKLLIDSLCFGLAILMNFKGYSMVFRFMTMADSPGAHSSC